MYKTWELTMDTEQGLIYRVGIKAPVNIVWDALTNPAVVKQYFFGTQLETSWMPGSPIVFRGEWEGTPYEDKGIVQAFEPMQRLAYSYWSSFSGTEDVPENYANIRYEVSPWAEGCYVTVTQDGFKSFEQLQHSENNWAMVFQNLRKLVEVKSSSVPG
jgi:uncharacterized protein YndB with AHSA1/START domain